MAVFVLVRKQIFAGLFAAHGDNRIGLMLSSIMLGVIDLCSFPHRHPWPCLDGCAGKGATPARQTSRNGAEQHRVDRRADRQGRNHGGGSARRCLAAKPAGSRHDRPQCRPRGADCGEVAAHGGGIAQATRRYRSTRRSGRGDRERDVADAKSDYLAAPLGSALQQTLSARAKPLADTRAMAENEYLRIRASFDMRASNSRARAKSCLRWD
jgi:hypothetical protein